jgi:hypothetical protein
MFALVLAAVLAAAPDDHVSRPRLDGFVVGNQQSANGASITEEVPAGETVDQWTRMVTTQSFVGLADRVDAKRFLEVLANSAAGSCSGAKASQLGDDGAEIRLDCPLNPQTRSPETFIAKAVTEGHDLHVFQVAWRRIPSAADLAWGQHYLDGISVNP